MNKTLSFVSKDLQSFAVEEIAYISLIESIDVYPMKASFGFYLILKSGFRIDLKSDDQNSLIEEKDIIQSAWFRIRK